MTFRYGLFLFFGAFGLSACEKPCTQFYESKARFENLTGAPVTVELMYVGPDSEYRNVTHSFVAGEASERDFYSASYEKEPIYHGKIDFDPEPPVCTSEPELRDTILQFAEPSSTLKLCQPRNGIVGEISTIYIQIPNAACPPGSGEMRRWEE